MPSPRTRPWVVPSAVQNAPLNARRSHLVPIYPEEFGPAVAEMDEGPAPRSFLPSKMAMQWNVKSDDGYRQWDTSPRSFVAMQATPYPPELTEPRVPFNTMAELAQTMQDAMWREIHTVEGAPPPALARTIPYPGRLPVQGFDQLDQWHEYPAALEQTRRRDRRMDAMRELAASDEMIAEMMRGRR